jgi:hypothetical protein
LAFEGAADTFGDALHECLQLRLTRRLNAAEHRGIGVDEIRAVEHEGVKMNVEIERRPKTLDQRHGTRRASPTRESGAFGSVASTKRSANDAFASDCIAIKIFGDKI